MSSDRPHTPPRSTYGNKSTATSANPNTQDASDLKKAAAPVEHLPHLSDLVYPLNRALQLTTKHIPPIFLGAEAVDPSVLLGHGASFTASLQRIPKGPERIEVTTRLTGWSVTRSTPAPPRPELVVYKVARVSFNEDGDL